MNYIPLQFQEKMTFLRSLFGSRCTNCGSIESLHFDHVLPEDKSFSISDKWYYELEKLLPELQQCQLLCSSCHGIKTRADYGARPMIIHGTRSMYNNKKCRCADCLFANTEYHRHIRAKLVPNIWPLRAWPIG